MIKINIQTEVSSVSDLSEMLKHIATQIDNGYTSGVSPTWDIVDETERERKITYIKKVLSVWGMTTTSELELESSPMYNSMSSNHFMLIEEFTQDCVRVFEYIYDRYVHEFELSYEELSDDLIDEIYTIIEGHEAYQEKI